ncbi:MAG: hypothetical protein ACMZ66_05530 [Thalassospira sp.]|uniref:hypothetical protein n=1 Tax=Thalassospira sp. TaxID=1912094 RepID=UPI003A8B2051
MTQINWYDLARVDLDDIDDMDPDQIARNTPEVHDVEWADELSPRHDVNRFLMVVGTITACVTIVLYALSEMREPLGKVWAWLGLPS